MIKNLDREKFLNNLQYRMGWMACTATTLEAEIGVYNGYISRMKSDPQKLPALDIAYRMAQALDVNIEWLIEGSAAPEDEDSIYLRRFVKRLFEMTGSHELRWTSYAYGEINEAIMCRQMPEKYPFLRRRGNQKDDPVCIHSLTLPVFDITLTGDVWAAPLEETRWIWMLPLHGTLEEADAQCDFIEMILQDRQNQAEPALICSSVMPGGDFLEPVLKELMDEIQVRAGDLVLDQDVKKVLDGFMERTNG